jgi:DNA-binding IclR family transcriptional regulator
MRVTDLAETLGVNRAVPHRLLATLIEVGFVYQDPVSDLYSLTYRVGALGLRQVEAAGFENWAQPSLDALARKTGELVRLALPAGDLLYFLAKAEGSNSNLRIDADSGAEVILHATASGRVWLSTMEPSRAKELLSGQELEKFTERTVTDLPSLMRILSEVARRGYATIQDERDLGVSAVAAPIWVDSNAGRRPWGTLSIAGPSVRMTPAVIDARVPDLLATAAAIAANAPVFEYLARQPAHAAVDRPGGPSQRTGMPGQPPSSPGRNSTSGGR